MYLVTVAGNTLIILVIGSDPRLHTPMYFFLTNLSFVDICFTTNLIPKLLASHVAGTWTISYPHCLTQMYFLITFANLDTFLLAAMALDRYVAICHPPAVPHHHHPPSSVGDWPHSRGRVLASSPWSTHSSWTD